MRVRHAFSMSPRPSKRGIIAALTCGADGEPKVRQTSRQVKCLVPAQGDGTRPNEVSAGNNTFILTAKGWPGSSAVVTIRD